MSGENSDIIVEGWSPRYAAAVDRLLGVEGGFVDDPLDRGGTTKFGISLRFLVAEGGLDLDGDGLADFDLDMDGDIDGFDIRKLTRGDAKYLYHRCFWQRLDADMMLEPIGEMLFDQGVNGGLVAARKMLQRALNACLVKYELDLPPLKVDGILGDKSNAATEAVLLWPARNITPPTGQVDRPDAPPRVERAGMGAIVAAYREAAKDRYRAIVAASPSQKRFLNGWLARANELGKPWGADT